MRWVPHEEVIKHLKMPDVCAWVETAFKARAADQAQMPPKMYINFPQFKGDMRFMPAYIPAMEALGIKIVNVHLDNPQKGLPTVQATIVLADPATGACYAVMDGTAITAYRTGAVGGLAVKALARANAHRMALVGAGAQAATQLEASCLYRDIHEVYVWSLTQAESLDWIDAHSIQFSGIHFKVCDSVEQAVKQADIVTTITPSRTPLVYKDWIRPGTHINAIGADAPGKQELETQILLAGRVFIDDWEQAAHGGEINVAVSTKKFTEQQVAGELGQVLSGNTPGRLSDDEITIFDSTGLALQDISVAKGIFQKLC